MAKRKLERGRPGKAITRAKVGSICVRAKFNGRTVETRCFSSDKTAEKYLNAGVKRGVFTSGATFEKKRAGQKGPR